MLSVEEFNRRMVETSNQKLVFFFKKELLNRDLTGISALNQTKLSELNIIKRQYDGEPPCLTEYGCELMRKNGIDVKIEEPPPEPPKPEPKPKRVKREKVGPVIRGQRISEGLKNITKLKFILWKAVQKSANRYENIMLKEEKKSR